MKWTSALAIYLLFWVLSAFVVLPFFARTTQEDGEALIPGQAESAPPVFEAKKIALWTTIVGSTAFGLFYANYVQGWIGAETIAGLFS